MKEAYLILDLISGYYDGWYFDKKKAQNQRRSLEIDFPKGDFILLMPGDNGKNRLPYSASKMYERLKEAYKTQ